MFPQSYSNLIYPSAGANNKQSELKINDTNGLQTNGDEDDYLDIYLSDDTIPTNLVRDASAEPACPADLTLLQAEVLQAEDDDSDRALRDIMAADSGCYNFEWSKDRRTFWGGREAFTGTSGPTFNVTNQT
ncbi:unnamed protein product, partial [Iphiclides podalirius]